MKREKNPEFEANQQEFIGVMQEGEVLRYGKMYDYGMSYKAHGSFGLVVRMHDKLARLTNLLKSDGQSVKDESLADTALDIMNYSAMLVMELREEAAKRASAPTLRDPGQPAY